MLKKLHRPLTYLAVAFGVAVVAFKAYPTESWQGSLALNLIAEVLGILATVYLVDQIMQSRANQERSTVRGLALRSLRVRLNGHLELLMGMYKAAASTAPSGPPTRPEALFTEDFFDTVAHLDLSAAAPILPARKWADHIALSGQEFQDAIQKALDKYIMFLESSDIQALEDLAQSTFFGLTRSLPTIFLLDQQMGVKRSYDLLNGAQDLIRAHTDRFLRVIELVSQQLEEPVVLSPHFWTDTSPQVGSARSG